MGEIIPATPQRPQNPKWSLWGPKMADKVWNRVYPQVCGNSRQLLQNKFFDATEKNKMEKIEGKMMIFIVATNIVAS